MGRQVREVVYFLFFEFLGCLYRSNQWTKETPQRFRPDRHHGVVCAKGLSHADIPITTLGSLRPGQTPLCSFNGCLELPREAGQQPRLTPRQALQRVSAAPADRRDLPLNSWKEAGGDLGSQFPSKTQQSLIFSSSLPHISSSHLRPISFQHQLGLGKPNWGNPTEACKSNTQKLLPPRSQAPTS